MGTLGPLYVESLPHETTEYVSIVSICVRWDGVDMGRELSSFPNPSSMDTNQETPSHLTITNRGNPLASENLAPRISQIRLQPPLRMHPNMS